MPDDRLDSEEEGPSPGLDPAANSHRLEPVGRQAANISHPSDEPTPAPATYNNPTLRSRLAGHAIRKEQQPGSWQQPAYGPAGYPGAWALAPASWPPGYVPWGYTNPPAVLPVLEPPGSFHPPISQRPTLSLKGRTSPRLYGLGLAAGLPGISVLLLYLVCLTAGIKLALGPVPPWLLIEAASLVAAVALVGWAIAQARHRRADGWRDYAGPSPLLTVGAFLGVTTALEIPVEMGLKAVHVDLQSAPATLLLLLVYLATYVGLVHFLAVRTGALTWRDIASPQKLAPSSDDWGSSEPAQGPTGPWSTTVGWVRSRVSGGRVGDILVALAMVIPLMLASDLLSAGMLLVLGLHAKDISPDTSVPTDGLSMVLMFVAVAIVAPIGEEIFFRGFATNAWGRSLSHNSAILRASLFFAFIHIMNTATTDASLSWRGAIFNFGARVPVAFALTWLYMRRRSILASGTLHAGYNGLITIISFL